MRLTINIKEQNKIARFLNLINKMDYIEIIDVKENTEDIPLEHKSLLDQRLQKIKNGKTAFKNWDLIKENYEIK
tara:strand:+ start:422 stop:643 length:222 start_codon:yes stop_codon:yes gene_type:complete